MKVKVLRNFFDKQHGLMLREKGDTFEVSRERAEQLLTAKVAEPVTESKKEPATTAAG